MTTDPNLDRLLSNPRQAITLIRLDDGAFGQYPDYFKRRIHVLADALATGKITVDEWLEAMKAEITELHEAAYMVSAGKQHNLDDKDKAIIAAIVATQLTFLVKWADHLRGQADIQASVLESRANMYLSESNATAQRGQSEAIGLGELPAYPADGSSLCMVNDKCSWRIEQLPGNGNFDCYWTLHPAEHCENCLKRAEVWNPLRVRAGQIENYPTEGLFADH